MMKNIISAIAVLVALISIVGAYTSANFVNSQPQANFQTYYTSSDVNTYWPILGDREDCKARQDIILQVAPAGCQPMVVRSDLLADQNVPVFCQIDALQINPLIDIKQIKNIRFGGTYPKEVAGTGFHPARAALQTRDILLGSPLINNIGYVVVVLKKTPNEKDMPDFVTVNLTAQMEYDAGNAIGIGRSEFLLELVSEETKELSKIKNSFWNGRYSLVLEEANPNYAAVSVYDGDRKISTTNVKKGELSREIYLPGSYCTVALQLQYTGLEAGQNRARISVTSDKGTDTFDAYDGSSFLNGKCRVKKIGIGSVEVTGKVYQSGNIYYLNADGKWYRSSSEDGTKDLVVLKNAPTIGNEQGKERMWKIPEKSTTTGNVIINCGGKDFTLDMTPMLEVGMPVIYYMADKQELKGTIAKIVKDGFEIKGSDGKVIQENNANKIFKQGEVKPETLADIKLGNEAESAFNEAIAAYEKVADDYPSEKTNPEGITTPSIYGTYGEAALASAVKIAEANSKFATKERLLTKLIDRYPDSANSDGYRAELAKLYATDLSSSSAIVVVNGATNIIRLESLNPPKKAPSATFYLDREQATLEKSEMMEFKEAGVQIKLNEVYADEARFEVLCLNKENKYEKDRDYALKTEDVGVKVCGNEKFKFSKVLKLSSVDMEKVAHIQVLPKSSGTGTETNLTVRIGIEKRAIHLSPEKTKEMVNNLNESIKRLEQISNRLANVVKGLKTACLATAAVLTVKNFISGAGGEAMARQQAMSGPTGWKVKCEDAINNKYIDRNGNRQKDEGEVIDYKTLTECFNKESDNINNDIKARTNAIQKVNEEIATVEDKSGISSGSLLLGKTVDEIKARDAYLAQLQVKYTSDREKSEYLDKLKGEVNNDGSAPFTYTDLRELEYNWELQGSKVASVEGAASGAITKLQSDINIRQEQLGVAKAGIVGIKPTLIGINVQSAPADGQVLDLKDDKLGGESVTGVAPPSDATVGMSVTGSKVVLGADGKPTEATEQPKNFIVFGNRDPNNKALLIPVAVYEYSAETQNNAKTIALGSKVYGEGAADNIDKFKQDYRVSQFNDIGGGLETGPIRVEDRKVRYFETGPDKGLASYIPLRPNEGFYVRIDSSLKIGTNIAAYDASGLPKAWSICNAGKYGIVERDDECYFYSGSLAKSILNQDEKTSAALFEDSKRAIIQANQHANDPFIEILGNKYPKGAPMSAFAGTECQEFMSVSDCKIMFNVCDPVICPPTRCNFGGLYPVADVIQQGIVGSALLCLPNYREGIVMPVCLSGIQAGLDAYVSMLKNHRDCLQKSLDSGQMVGICDQIYSIYMCDFFWKQIGPVANVLLPKLIQMMYTGAQGARGGGEYLTVQTAWNNAQSSINYVTQSYAVNSFKAFQARTISEAGAEICNAYISAKGPTALQSLVEPESPPQFNAWFSSTSYTSATVPATAQYKVFYHIFAGNNAGVYYSVYLKSPPQTAYYAQASEIPVASGFIGKGEYASQTKDFTAPEGYQELCVRINNENKCGFKQVSTSYALNTLRDSYVQEQITQKDIKSQSECISGSASLGAILANTNPQAALEEAALPGIQSRGIIRICSSTNPGASTDPTRYQEVGYCDTQNMKCWLDRNSVQTAITENNLGLKNATINELNANLAKQEPGKYYIDTTGVAELKNLGTLADNLAKNDKTSADNLIARIDSLFDNFVMNNQKAALLLIRARIIEKKYYKILYPTAAPGGAVATAAAPMKIEEGQFYLIEKYDSAKKQPLYIDGVKSNFYLNNNILYYRDESVTSGNPELLGTVKNNIISVTKTTSGELYKVTREQNTVFSTTEWGLSLIVEKFNKLAIQQGTAPATTTTAAAPAAETQATPLPADVLVLDSNYILNSANRITILRGTEKLFYIQGTKLYLMNGKEVGRTVVNGIITTDNNLIDITLGKGYADAIDGATLIEGETSVRLIPGKNLPAAVEVMFV
jgi:hypothetical protein